MTNARLAYLALLAPVLALPACGGDEAAAPPDGAVALALTTEGTYQVTSPIDLTALALAPDSTVKAVRLVKGLKDDPASTFFEVLDEAGVPLANDLYGALPGPLKDKVKGWINEAIRARMYEGKLVPAELEVLVMMLESTLVRFDLLTDLTLPGASVDASPPLAAHDFRGVRYESLGGRLPLVIPRLVDKHTIIDAETRTVARVGAPMGGGDAGLELGDHAFGVPYGQYAWAALDVVSNERYGAPLRPALGKLVDCAGMSQSVAGKCVLSVCVGHQAELLAVCEAGLDRVVAKVQEGVQAYNFNAVRFKQGRGQLWDAPAAGGAADGRADRIAAGTWEAFIDAGKGPREMRATFTGARR
jgi:hypothetical protein